jgi:hypothetical protein
MGFDDADIRWFLHKHRDKSGDGLQWLRNEYQGMLDTLPNYAPGSVLFFFPVPQDKAQQILQDIKK